MVACQQTQQANSPNAPEQWVNSIGEAYASKQRFLKHMVDFCLSRFLVQGLTEDAPRGLRAYLPRARSRGCLIASVVFKELWFFITKRVGALTILCEQKKTSGNHFHANQALVFVQTTQIHLLMAQRSLLKYSNDKELYAAMGKLS